MSHKLIDDCFRTDLRDQNRMTHDATLALIRERVQPVVMARPVAVADAVGTVLAQDVVAPIAVPGHTNSAVDGYAFAHTNIKQDAGNWFDVKARVPAGVHGEVPMTGDAAARIFTGAVMPIGLDTVAMQEDCEIAEDGTRVFVPAGLKAGANVRQAGEDVQAGELIIRRGQLVRPMDVAALSSVGVRDVSCYGVPRIGIVSTGDEVVRNGGALQPGQVHDVNTPMLLALAKRCAVDVTDLGVWPDQRSAVLQNLTETAGQYDLLITSGGASQGEEDHISHALAELGARHFWQIAVKPGRPLMLGQVADTAVVGLPGNPVAVFVCFLMYVWPLIRQLGGAEWREPRRFPIRANFDFPNRKVGRREFWRGTTKQTPEGLFVEKFARDGSGLISGLRAADGLIDIPENVPAIQRGQIVDFIPFSEFGILD
jgi:molybdopterin molybdotransferase